MFVEKLWTDARSEYTCAFLSHPNMQNMCIHPRVRKIGLGVFALSESQVYSKANLYIQICSLSLLSLALMISHLKNLIDWSLQHLRCLLSQKEVAPGRIC